MKDQSFQDDVQIKTVFPFYSGNLPPFVIPTAFKKSTAAFATKLLLPKTPGHSALIEHLRKLPFSVFTTINLLDNPNALITVKSIVFLIEEKYTKTAQPNEPFTPQSICKKIILPRNYNTGQPYIPFDGKELLLLDDQQQHIVRAIGTKPKNLLKGIELSRHGKRLSKEAILNKEAERDIAYAYARHAPHQKRSAYPTPAPIG